MSGVYGGCYSFVTLFLGKNSLTKTDRCAGALWWSKNKLLVLYFSERFFFYLIPKATKCASLLFCIHSSNSCKFYQRIPGTFWSYYVYTFRGLWFIATNRLVSASCAFWWENSIQSASDSCHMFCCAASRFVLYCGILIIRLIYWSVTHVSNGDPVTPALVSFTLWSAA